MVKKTQPGNARLFSYGKEEAIFVAGPFPFRVTDRSSVTVPGTRSSTLMTLSQSVKPMGLYTNVVRFLLLNGTV